MGNSCKTISSFPSTSHVYALERWNSSTERVNAFVSKRAYKSLPLWQKKKKKQNLCLSCNRRVWSPILVWATGWAHSILDPVVHRLTHRVHIPDRPPPWATTSRRNLCAILRSLFSLVFLEMALLTSNIFNSKVQLTRFYLAIYKLNFRYPYIAYGKGYQYVWFHSDEMSKRDKSEIESHLVTARS